MDRKRILRIGALAIALLCIMFALLGWIFLSRMRTNLRELRPLVLIHSPHNQQQFDFGEPVTVHATAREQGGVEHIELWVDGEFVREVHALEEEMLSILVLHVNWIPETSGRHNLIVRARSAGGVHGQASLNIEVLESNYPGVMSEVSVGEAGGDVPPTGMNEDQPASGAPPAPSSDSVPRVAPPAPGSLEDVVEQLGLPSGEEAGGEDEPLVLRVEVLALRTDRRYAGLHCYLGAADVPPRWYPDEDDDQSTDESFPSLGGGAWDVASSLSGETAPAFVWSSAEPIVMDVTCVGLISGGREAVEIGRIQESISPRNWDGITRRLESVDIEGHFTLDYRIAAVGEDAPGHPIALDMGMTAPTNLRLVAGALEWDYDPPEDEEEISGFRVFLNDIMLWQEHRDERQSILPYEWLTPPCGQEYRFYVDAVRNLDWSYPSNMVTTRGPEPGSEECAATVVVTFRQLETYDLGRDEGRSDRVGPVYGSFFVNDQFLRFDGRSPDYGITDRLYFSDSQIYPIDMLTTFWGDSGPSVTTIAYQEDVLLVGFEIRDQDPSSWNSDDDVCADMRDIYLDRVEFMVVGNPESGCEVHFALDTPFGPFGVAGIPDDLPMLPLIEVTNLTVDDTTGQLEIHVENIGRATWPGRDLVVEVTRPQGEFIGRYVFADFLIQPGQTDILRHPEMAPDHHPLRACITLDPDNQVPEEEDYMPWRTRRIYCQRLPDLYITDVTLDRELGQLETTVINIGRGALENRTLELVLRLDEDVFVRPPYRFPGVSMESWDSRIIVWSGIDEETQARLVNGYQVIVDPYDRIAEVDNINNSYVVPAQ